MATATKLCENKVVEKVVTEIVTEQVGVSLNLSTAEAETLAVILCKIGGDPYDSPRKNVESMSRALEGQGVYYINGSTGEYLRDFKCATGNLYFNKYND